MHTILSVSDSNKHFQTPIDEYLKRLGKQLRITDIKPNKHGSRRQIIAFESSKLADKVKTHKTKGYRIVLLAKEGQHLTTQQLHQKYVHTDTVFIIGGPYGIDNTLLDNLIDDHISLGAYTMPHGLAKLVLIEQLYRIQMIEQGRSYHY